MVDRRDQRGSVMMLMPAAVLVLVILGSIAVDSAMAFNGQRELDDYTEMAATTSASAALDAAAFYNDRQIVIDPQRAADIAQRLQARIGSGVHDVHVLVTVNGSEVTVSASGVVDDLFARAIPGAHQRWTVRAESSATARSLGP